MLSLVPDALRAHAGLTDPTDPLLTVRVQIKDGEDLQVFLTPSDGEVGPFTALIRRRLMESPAPKVPGAYIWKVRQYSDLVTLADDASHACFLFGLFRRDLGPAFEAMEEMVHKLPSRAALQDAVDRGVCALLRRSLKDGTSIDPREFRLSTLCEDCGQAELEIRASQLGGQIEQSLDKLLAWVKKEGIGLPEEVSREIKRRVHKTAMAPAPKPSEFFLVTPVNHGHPFYDLSIQLMDEAGSRLLRERAVPVARDFLVKVDAFSRALREMLGETS